MSLRRFILLCYTFVQWTWKYTQVQKECCLTSDDEDGETTELSFMTINKYTVFFREIIADHMLGEGKKKKIGGPGLTVEVDESMFGKRKYNRGTIEGRRQAWVLGGVCRETKEIFLVLCPENKRDRATLEKIIMDNVEPGCTVYTDGWAAYKKLDECGYSWDFVNHSEEFVKTSNPSVHTQSIEGCWFQVKRWLPSSGRYNLSFYLPVYLWSMDCARRGVSPFWELLNVLSKCDGSELFGLKTDSSSETVKVPSAIIPCLFCGKDCKGERGLNLHLKTCKIKNSHDNH